MSPDLIRGWDPSRRGLSDRSHENSNARSHSRDADSVRVVCTNAPSENRGRRECWAPDAPAAACGVESTRVSHHGHTGITRHSPRSGFNGFLRALPGDRACLSPSPLRSLLLKSLTPASRRQDHTTSPSAKAFRKSCSAVLVPSRRSSSEGGSAPLVLRRCRVHRIPHPTSVTIAIRPSDRGGMGRACRDDLPDGESGKFFRKGLDDPNQLESTGVFALKPHAANLRRARDTTAPRPDAAG